MAVNNKEKVLIVHNFYQIGGGEHTVFENEVALLRNHGHDVITYTRDNAELNDSFIEKVLLPFTAVFSLKTYIEVTKIIKQNNVDIIHCHNTFPLISPSVYYAALRYKIPIVQTIHNFRFLCPCGVFYRDGRICEDCMSGSFKSAMKHNCYRKSKLQTAVVVNMLKIHRLLGTYKRLNYIFLTDFNKEKFKSIIGHARTFVKANFEQIQLTYGEKVRDNKYVFIGRLEQNKGVDFLLKVWEEIEEYDLYIFGDGTFKENAIDADRTQKNIHYMAFQPRDAVFEHLMSAKGLIFPSEWYEGFPMTIIESLACATPIICSNIGNHAAIVQKANAGAIFELHNKKSFIDAINTIEKNFDQLSNNARDAYINNYTAEINYEKLMNIYKAIKKK